MTEGAEQIEDLVSRGTTDHGKVSCLYFDKNFALVKWPGGPVWSGMYGTRYVSPSVKRYEFADLGRARGREVWNCANNRDGRLTKKRLAQLIEREKGSHGTQE